VSADLDLAERVLSFCDGEAQVTITRERSLHARFARSQPTQATDLDDASIHVLVLRDGQAGVAQANDPDEQTLRSVVAQATTAAQAAAADGPGDHPGLPAPTPYGAHAGYDEATAQLDPVLAGAQLGAAFAVAAEHGLQAFGIWTVGVVRTTIASSSGIRATDAVTDAYGKVVLRDAAGRSSYEAGSAVAAADVSLAGLAQAAAARVPKGALTEVAAGTYPVVLGELAVGELLEFLGTLAFNGLSYAEGRSALVGRLGEQVAAPCVDLTDAPRLRGTLPRAFDAEGVPKAPRALLTEGVAQGVVHDTRSAARAGGGARSTGHALAPGGSPCGPAPTNLVLAGGDAAGVEALAAPIDRGLYVHRLWYTNPVIAQETLLTGVTRDGTHLIEDGAITRPVRDVRFTDSILSILSGVEALAAAPRLVSGAEFYGRRFATGTVCPPLRAAALRITGGG
jgi:predicted Zn-dependent protease